MHRGPALKRTPACPGAPVPHQFSNAWPYRVPALSFGGSSSSSSSSSSRHSTLLPLYSSPPSSSLLSSSFSSSSLLSSPPKPPVGPPWLPSPHHPPIIETPTIDPPPPLGFLYETGCTRAVAAAALASAVGGATGEQYAAEARQKLSWPGPNQAKSAHRGGK